MREIWNRIEAWLAENAPLVLESLNSGATEAEVAQAEAFFGVKFSDDFRQSYLIHNGGNGEYSLFPHLDFLSLREMIEESKVWQQVPAWETLSEFVDEGIWNGCWHSHWIPFARESTGACKCVDLAPATGGTVGQTIAVEAQNSARWRLMSSFQVHMEAFADSLYRGEYLFSEEDYGLDYAPHRYDLR